MLSPYCQALLPKRPESKPTDIFESIEGQSTRDMSLPEIRNHDRGRSGSTLNVQVVRARRAEPQKIVITRDVVSVPADSDKMMEDGIGYIKVEALTKGKSQEIASKIKSLEKSGAKKILLDLRNCAEGDENEGIADCESVPEPRHHYIPAGAEVSPRGFQCRSARKQSRHFLLRFW